MDGTAYGKALNDVLNQHFLVERGDASPERLMEVYALREQVYAKERKFEAPSAHGFEHTDADFHSEHTVLIHRGSGVMLGTTRLILPSRLVAGPAESFPFQEAFPEVEAFHVPGYLDYAAELGRFTISQERRLAIAGPPKATNVFLHVRQQMPFWEGKEENLLPALMDLAPLLLVRGAIERAMELGARPPPFAGPGEPQVDYLLKPEKPRLVLYNAVDVALEKLLGTRFSIHGERVMPPVEFHGKKRALQKIFLPQMLEACQAEKPEIKEVLTDGGRLTPPIEEAVADVKPELLSLMQMNLRQRPKGGHAAG